MFSRLFDTRYHVKQILWGGVIIFVVIQFARFVIPAWEISNPPVVNNIEWDSDRTEALWRQACADCHSNETAWPWYSYIAPITWLVAHDTNEGRDQFNISEDRFVEFEEIGETIENGSMPLSIYEVLHPAAKLSDEEKDALITGLRTSLANTPSIQNGENDEGEERGEGGERGEGDESSS